MTIKRNYYPINKAQFKKFNLALKNVLKSNIFINSTSVKNFENKFSEFHKTKYLTLGFSSASTSISALVDFVCKKNFKSEIIIPAFSPIPVLMAILNFGYKVKFVDIDPETLLMDLSKVRKAITKNTKIIMPVHLFGNVVDIKSLKKIINKDIYIIEDTSQAHFSKINDNFAGLQGDASVFSFYPTKNLWAIGDAGALMIKNKKSHMALKAYRNYGLHPYEDRFLNFGNNFRMDEFQAEVLLLNLKTIHNLNNSKLRLSNYYKKKLNNLPINFQNIPNNVVSNFHVFSIIVNENIRDSLYNFLKKKKIDAIIYYPKPLPFILHKTNDKKKLIEMFPNSYKISKEIISLPISAHLKNTDIDFVCDQIRAFFSKI
jgi:dTDP-4-amino-4,6-dideoxygalactose transaminase